METTTQFDLNQAVQQWRDSLTQSPAIQAENRDELEIHLRDSVARLQARELSTEEAFIIATKRIGSPAKLGAEYSKVNSQSAWLDRLFWGLILMQMWSLLEMVGYGFANIFNWMLGSPKLGALGALNHSMGWFSTVLFQMTSYLIPTLVAVFLIWRLFKSPQNRLKATLEKLSNQPGTLAGVVLGADVLFHAIYMATFVIFEQSIIHLPLITYFKPLALYSFYSSVIFILARKRLLKKA